MVEKYTATLESIGEWDGNEPAAVRNWNTHILPVLTDSSPIDDATGERAEPLVSRCNGTAAYANEWAWEEFCARGGDDEVVAMAIAEELAAKLAE